MQWFSQCNAQDISIHIPWEPVGNGNTQAPRGLAASNTGEGPAICVSPNPPGDADAIPIRGQIEALTQRGTLSDRDLNSGKFCRDISHAPDFLSSAHRLWLTTLTRDFLRHLRPRLRAGSCVLCALRRGPSRRHTSRHFQKQTGKLKCYFVDIQVTRACCIGCPRKLSLPGQSKGETNLKLECGRVRQRGRHCPVQHFYSTQLPHHPPESFLTQKPGRWVLPGGHSLSSGSSG